MESGEGKDDGEGVVNSEGVRRSGDNGKHYHHLDDVAHHRLHKLVGGGAMVSTHYSLHVVRCMWAVDGNGEHGKRSGRWAVGFVNEMVVGGKKGDG